MYEVSWLDVNKLATKTKMPVFVQAQAKLFTEHGSTTFLVALNVLLIRVTKLSSLND